LALLWCARYAWFTTYQSPLLGVIWRGLDAGGGIPLLFGVQCLFVSVAVAASLSTIWRGRFLAIGVPAVLFFPAVGPYAGSLVKDTWFWAACLISYAAYLASRRSGRAGWLIPFGVAVALAVQFRINGVFAYAPIMLDLLLQWWRRPGWPRLRTLGGAVTLGGAIVVGAFAILPLLRTRYPVQYQSATQVIYLSDLAALTLATGEWLIPEEANPDGIGMERLRGIFNPRYCSALINYRGNKKDCLLLSMDPEVGAVYREAWLESIRKYPKEFVLRHLRFLYAFLGLDQEYGWFYQKQSTHHDEDPVFERTGWSDRYLSFVDRFEPTPLNTLWPYLLVAALASLVRWRLGRGDVAPVLLLAGSAWAYGIGFGLIGYHIGFRYLWFPAAVGTVLCFDLLGSISSAFLARGREEERSLE